MSDAEAVSANPDAALEQLRIQYKKKTKKTDFIQRKGNLVTHLKSFNYTRKKNERKCQKTKFNKIEARKENLKCFKVEFPNILDSYTEYICFLLFWNKNVSWCITDYRNRIKMYFSRLFISSMLFPVYKLNQKSSGLFRPIMNKVLTRSHVQDWSGSKALKAFTANSSGMFLKNRDGSCDGHARFRYDAPRRLKVQSIKTPERPVCFWQLKMIRALRRRHMTLDSPSLTDGAVEAVLTEGGQDESSSFRRAAQSDCSRTIRHE